MIIITLAFPVSDYSLEISALIEIIGIWCPEGTLHAAEQHVKQLKCSL